MNDEKIDELVIIAGRGAYPRILAESARKQGVQKLRAVAFKKETDPVIADCVDAVDWVTLGQFQRMLDALESCGIKSAVMVGQITPTHLFRVKLDSKILKLLAGLKERNADTIFGAVAEELQQIGISLLPASSFMESTMPEPGVMTQRQPAPSEINDLQLGLRVASATSELNVGQTVVVKQGTILAVEAFDGTDATIKRAAKLGGDSIVVVKIAGRGHDMRFDIPIVGTRTIKLLVKLKATVLAVEARKTIFLEKEEIVRRADSAGICITAVEMKGQAT